MAITFQRLTSTTTTVFLGTDRNQAAMNAANFTGDHPDAVARNLNPTWPSLKKFDNDTTAQSFSPFGGISNPDYIWDQPTSDGQTAVFAIASNLFTTNSFAIRSSTVFLVAFADNAMEAKIELFERIGGTFVKVTPQPSGLGDVLFVAGNPNPDVGVTETQPYNWQDIRVYSTSFDAPSPPPDSTRVFKIVVSFEVTNYLPTANNSNNPNPAGLQFIIDIYQDLRPVG